MHWIYSKKPLDIFGKVKKYRFHLEGTLTIKNNSLFNKKEYSLQADSNPAAPTTIERALPS